MTAAQQSWVSTAQLEGKPAQRTSSGDGAATGPAAPTNHGRWQELSACHGMDTKIFFPDLSHLGKKPSVAVVRAECAEALAVCAECPVTEQCTVLGWNRPGVYGGLVESERSTRAIGSRARAAARRARVRADIAEAAS